MSTTPGGPATFTVTMLSVLRPEFEAWLARRMLVMARIPDVGAAYVVIPHPDHPAMAVSTEQSC